MSTSNFGKFVILINGNNFYHTVRDLQLHVDYKKFLAYFRTCGTLIRAHYFTAFSMHPTRQTGWFV